MTVDYHFRDAAKLPLPLRTLNRGCALLEQVGGPTLPSLDPDSIVRAARKRAGASDLGSDSYREPLERYLEAARREADLNAFGRLGVREMLTSALSNRIRLHDWANAHPEIREERIERPWIIVGLPRTGTSLLSILLGLDPLARPPLQWELANLVPPPTLANATTDPRIAEFQRSVDQLHRLNPAFAAMHPTGATLAQECVALFMYDVRTLGVETQALVPSYGQWLEGCDMGPAYAQHRLGLQALQAAQPTERWILKTPNHLWCLPTLLEAYPDARIIWTHRDPGPVVTSLASLVNTLQSQFTDRTDPRPTAEEWKKKVRFALESGMAFDEKAPEQWCFHLRYDRFLEDPIEAVRGVYTHFETPLFPLHIERMRAWLAERHQTALGRHVYDPADFGWSYASLADEFAGYRRRYLTGE